MPFRSIFFSKKMKTLVHEIKNHGLKIGLGNSLILFTKWFVNAKRISVTYR